MNTKILSRIALLAIVALSLAVAGCGSSPTAKFYVLSAVKTQEAPGNVASQVERPSLAIGPVEIPDYLDRPQIVTRTTQNELFISEFDRWGGSIKDDVERVLVENLGALLASDGIVVFSWNRRLPASYRMPVKVLRFDADPGGSVPLKVLWSVGAPDGRSVLLMRESTISQSLSGRDYGAIVAAMSQALGAMSQEMAAGIKSVVLEKK